jgi:hypothetical protein
MITLKDIAPDDMPIYVGLLTEDQKNQLTGQLYTDDSYFNPIQDAEDNWVISTEEIQFCTNPDFLWVKDLPLILYNPKPSPPSPPLP